MNKYSSLCPSMQLRQAQLAFLDDASTKLPDQGTYLMNACPGSGKTLSALCLAKILLQKQMIDHIVVFVPTDHLRTQYGRAAAQLTSLQLCYSKLRLSLRGYDGEVLTYQKLSSESTLQTLAQLSESKKLLIIADECHHLSTTQAWGSRYAELFDRSNVYNLMTTGTPFRESVPLVSYWAGQCVPDYSYSYKDAVADQVCRRIIFPTIDGSYRWEHAGSIYEHSFADEIPTSMQRQRVNTALDTQVSDWFERTFSIADRRLDDMRITHPSAAGLILAKDTSHADRLAEQVRHLTGISPAVVHSELDADSSAVINRFRQSRDKWIVSVKMISEGVDIPRVRITIGATNVMTKLWFYQAFVGRNARVVPGIPFHQQVAETYLLPDPQLREYALEVMEDSRYRNADNEDEPGAFEGSEIYETPVAFGSEPGAFQTIEWEDPFTGELIEDEISPDDPSVDSLEGIQPPEPEIRTFTPLLGKADEGEPDAIYHGNLFSAEHRLAVASLIPSTNRYVGAEEEMLRQYAAIAQLRGISLEDVLRECGVTVISTPSVEVFDRTAATQQAKEECKKLVHTLLNLRVPPQLRDEINYSLYKAQRADGVAQIHKEYLQHSSRETAGNSLEDYQQKIEWLKYQIRVAQ